jgi:hypothetical protein
VYLLKANATKREETFFLPVLTQLPVLFHVIFVVVVFIAYIPPSERKEEKKTRGSHI